MQISILKSKIHKAVITFQDLYYEGSLTIDQDLMDEAGIYPYEKLLVVNSNNGERFETYAIPGDRGTGIIGLNGAAARKGMKGDLLTIMAFGKVQAGEKPPPAPRILILDAGTNTVVQRREEAGEA